MASLTESDFTAFSSPALGTEAGAITMQSCIAYAILGTVTLCEEWIKTVTASMLVAENGHAQATGRP